MTSLVIAKNLVKKFKQFTAVNGISFEINEGECFGFLLVVEIISFTLAIKLMKRRLIR